MTEPRTAAGRALLDIYDPVVTNPGASNEVMLLHIRAIEAEAVAAWRDALEQAVRMLDWTADMAVHLPAGYDDVRLAALRLIYPDSQERAEALMARLREKYR